MNCPKCNFVNGQGALECMKCGIIFAKWQANALAAGPRTVTSSAPPTRMSSPGGATMAVGAAAIHPMQHSPVTFFGAIPCPFCGAETTTQANASDGKIGGLVEVMITHAVSARYQCAEHGIIESEQFPSEVRRIILMRKGAMILAAITLFIIAFWILVKVD